jgi:hypothetical protein
MATSKIHDDFLVVQNASDDAPSDLGYRPCKLAKKGQILEVYVKVFEINTGVRLDRSKTVGVISANNDDTVLMSAHSGYTAGPRRDDRCLDTAKWNNLALSM